MPTGYKVGFQQKQGNRLLVEMLPQAETVQNWTEMLTTQIFFGLKTVTPEQFKASMSKGWLSACKDGSVAPIAEGEENGYVFSMWLQICPLNPASGKPEYTWLKAIKGSDSFCMVQKAFRFSSYDKQVVEWTQYFRTVTVCDSRLADRECPALSSEPQ